MESNEANAIYEAMIKDIRDSLKRRSLEDLIKVEEIMDRSIKLNRANGARTPGGNRVLKVLREEIAERRL